MKRNRKFLIMILIVYLVTLVFLLFLILPTAMITIRKYIKYQIRPDVLTIVFVCLILLITILIGMIFSIYSEMKKMNNKTDDTSFNILFDDQRSYLERQISELNEKLVSTDERWKEVYHLILTSQNRQNEKTGEVSVSKFLNGFGIDYINIKIENNLVFILTPFHEDFAQTYNIISETCSEIKLTAMRGDEEFIPKDVLQHIIKCIVKARVVVANLNGRNPNVFYELGIAHALNKPTILLTHKDTQVPFDLQNQYLILYKDENELKKRLAEALLMVITHNN